MRADDRLDSEEEEFMSEYKVDFASLDWQSPMEGVRQKAISGQGKKLRLVEYSPAMGPHWCTKGHFGYVLEGKLQIEFEKVMCILEKGDGVFIPDGAAHRHRAEALTDVVRVIFVEDE